MKKNILIFLLMFTINAIGTENRLDEWDYGFLAGNDTCIDGGNRLRILNPVIEHQGQNDGRSFTAVRPFFSTINDPVRNRSVTDFLWPLCSVKKFRGETDWHFLSAFGHDFDNTDPNSRWRTWVLPVLYVGRDINGKGYFSVFPLGGTLHEFLGRDKIQFFLFPLFAHSSVNDTETWDFLWPFISRTKGGGVSRFKMFPLYGRSSSDNGTVKQFILWPLWTSASYRSDKVSGNGWVLFPLLGHCNMSNQKSWMVLPPFFRYGKSANETLLHCPWPFFQYRSGEVNRLYLWPLWGKKKDEEIKSWFALWPVVSSEHITRASETVDRFRILPIFYHESKESRPVEKDGEITETETKARSWTFWPLVSYRQEGAERQLRFPELWPLRRAPAVERNLAPLWTIFSRTVSGENKDMEILWGLFRKQKSGDKYSHVSLFPLFSASRSNEKENEGKKFSLLCGLIGYEREGLRRRIRLLYFLKIPFGKKSETE